MASSADLRSRESEDRCRIDRQRSRFPRPHGSEDRDPFRCPDGRENGWQRRRQRVMRRFRRIAIPIRVMPMMPSMSGAGTVVPSDPSGPAHPDGAQLAGLTDGMADAGATASARHAQRGHIHTGRVTDKGLRFMPWCCWWTFDSRRRKACASSGNGRFARVNGGGLAPAL